MTISNEGKDKIFFNTPKNLNIRSAFADFENLELFLPKIEFLLHQINKFTLSAGYYQLNKKNHSWCIGFRDGDLTKVIDRLIKLNIIKLHSMHQSNEHSKSYTMINPYQKRNSTVNTHFVYEQVFMEKLVADGYVVKAKEHSNFVKQVKTPAKAEDSKDALILSLQARVKELESLLVLVPGLKTDLGEAHIIYNTTIEPVKTPDLIIEDFGGFSMQIDGYREYSKVVHQLTEDEVLDLKTELLGYMINEHIGNVDIAINDRVLTFFVNFTCNFVQFKSALFLPQMAA